MATDDIEIDGSDTSTVTGSTSTEEVPPVTRLEDDPSDDVKDPLDAGVTEIPKKMSDNCIVLYNSEINTRTTIKVDNINQTKDIRVKFKPLPPDLKYMSWQKLRWYSEYVKDYMDDPTIEKIICTPEISDVVEHPGKITFEITPYKSYIMLEHVSTEIEISPLEDFSILEKFWVRHDTERFSKEIEFSTLRHRQKYYFRIRYGGAGYASGWSNVLTFTAIKATIPTPTVNPITEDLIVFDKLNLPIVNFTASPYMGTGTHTYTTIKIWGEDLDGKELLQTIVDDKYLTYNSLEKLYPNTLSYGRTYWISISYHNENFEYSEDSPKVPFEVNAIVMDPPKDFTTFPKAINTSNPMLSFNSNLTYKFQNKLNAITIDDIREITWNIFKNDGKRIFQQTTKDVSLNLPVGTLEPNTSYYVTVYYTHRTLGKSPVATFRFRTQATYKPVEDGLENPETVYNNCAFYGEILKDKCMDEHISYVGVWKRENKYLRYQEVSRDNNLYICVLNTPTDTQDYDFNQYFKDVTSVQHEFYKSGIPTPRWIIDYLEINPNQTGGPDEIYKNFINKDTSWLKLQNQKGKILYVTKQCILDKLSVNDLIKADLYHPRRKTVRIFNRLYYVRTLVSTLEQGYDTPDPQHFENKAFNRYFSGRDPISYGEDKMLEYLVTNKLAGYSPSDLDIPQDDYTELIYTHNKLCGYRAYASINGYSIINSALDDPNAKVFSLRLVLEYIPETEHPMDHISARLPGNNTPEEDKTDKWGEVAFLGIVSVEDFVGSAVIDARTDFNSFKSVPILNWLKFYYRGLIYYVTLGDAFVGVNFNELNEANMVYPTMLFTKEKTIGAEKPGKVIFNDLIFNVSLPSVLNYKTMSERYVWEDLTKEPVTIRRNTEEDIGIGFNSFLSNTIYGIYDRSALHHEEKSGNLVPGYKGSYRHYLFGKFMDKFSNIADIKDRYTLTQNETKEGNVFVNRSWFINTVDVISKDTPTNTIICLTICPTIDNDNIWGY